MNRREAVQTIATGLLLAPRAFAQSSALAFAAIDHIEFFVSDVARTRDFYAALFGKEVLKNTSAAKNYVRLGSSYMAFERPRAAGAPVTTDHVSLSIRNVDMARVHDFLNARSIAYRDYPSGRDTAVVDGDGIRTQLSPENGWSLLQPPNFTPDEADAPPEPVFRAEGIDHVLLNVSDTAAALAFYEKVIGPVDSRSSGVSWFRVGRSRLGVQKAAAQDPPGARQMAITVAPFNYATAVARLTELGRTIEAPTASGVVGFRDPDGMLVQVGRWSG